MASSTVYRHHVLSIGFLLPLLGGCSVLSDPSDKPQTVETDGITMVTVPHGARESYFSDAASKARHCRAPSPDFSVTSSGGINLSVATPSSNEDLGSDRDEGALGLGGRSPEVLIARELMYRACELSTNLDADQTTTIQIYERFLQSVETIATSQTGAGDAGQSLAAPDARITPPAPSSFNQ